MARKRIQGSAIPVYLIDGETGDVISSTDPLQVSSGGGGGGNSTIIAPLGRQGEATGVSVTLSTQDKAVLDTIESETADTVSALNGLNSTIGAVGDAAVITDADGTISAKLRGLVVILADVWNNALNALGVNVLAWGGTAISLGQKTSANSIPVVLASDYPGSPSDGLGGASVLATTDLQWNEATGTFERARGNIGVTILASAARTTAAQSTDQINYNWRGLHLVINITAVSGAAALTFTVEGKDPISGTYYPLLVSTALVATGITVLRIYPGIGVTANLSASDILPRIWRVSVGVATADSATYSIAAHMAI